MTKATEGQFYLDASALTKIYLPEAESAAVEALLHSETGALCSTLAQAECVSALQRRVRAGLLKPEEADSCWQALQHDLRTSAFLSLDVTSEDLREAVGVLREYGFSHALRTLDAIHLACARNAGVSRFLTFDTRQRRAAELMGFGVPVLG